MITPNTDIIEITKQSISLIVTRYRGDKSLREFAADLSSKLPEPISYTSIKNWEDKVFIPAYYPMLAIALHNDDWRRQFALEILAVLKPELHNPDLSNTNS
jgi:hypothetical protein